MRMTLKKIVELDLHFGTPLEIMVDNPNKYLEKGKSEEITSKCYRLGYYNYTTTSKDKNNKSVPMLVYENENGRQRIEIPKIKGLKVLECKRQISI